MARFPLAAAAALVALAVASPAIAKGKPASPSPAHAVPAAVSDLPQSPDSDIEDKIDQLTGIIAELNDRLESLEDAIGEPDDQDTGDPDDNGFDLARARGAPHPAVLRHRARSLRTGQQPAGNAFCPSAEPAALMGSASALPKAAT